MELVHFSAEPLVFDNTRTYDQPPLRGYGKPRGLWLSDDSEHGWKQWCESEDWNLGGFEYRTPFVITTGANVLTLRNMSNLLSFDDEYGAEAGYGIRGIDWARVAADYDGILITPYIWEARLDGAVSWYYGWDCASGCFWNLSAIEQQDFADTGSAMEGNNHATDHR